MKRELIISCVALDDLKSINNYLYLKIKIPITVEKFLNDFTLFFIDIANHPEAYPKNQFAQLKKYGSENLQKAVFRKKWVVLFDVTHKRVVIRKIIYGARIIDKTN